MEFNNKRLEKTSKLINYIIAIVLCGFLISLSARIMDDVDQWKERPMVSEFQNHEFLDQKRAEVSVIDGEIAEINEKQRNIQNKLQVASNNYNNAKNSFDNWLAARSTVGSSSEDEEVISRANALDEFYVVEQDLKKQYADLEAEEYALNQKRELNYQEQNREDDRAYEELNTAIRKYDLKVFLIRLMFVLPILLLGIFFIMKFRKHKFWPLFLGFVLFSFYAFFFGLVPYLPSYGGYVRYGVGIVLCVLLGIYAINKIRAFISRKKEELKVSTNERAKKVVSETAEKALDNHMCPSCGKDFIIKRWDKSAKSSKNDVSGMVTNFCRFCGLEFFKPCNNCGTENFAHLPYCSKCGDPVSGSEENQSQEMA
ncbi:MAG: hypothetical protein ACPGED_04630 [Flavobacteriales bacterium]